MFTIYSNFANRVEPPIVFRPLLQRVGRTVVDALLDVNPRHARARNLRGVICATNGDHACAIAAFEASLQRDPRDSTVYVNLGKAYLERGDVERAEKLFSEAVALDPGAEAARTALRTMAR